MERNNQKTRSQSTKHGTFDLHLTFYDGNGNLSLAWAWLMVESLNVFSSMYELDINLQNDMALEIIPMEGKKMNLVNKK